MRLLVDEAARVLLDLREQRDISMLFITHDLALAGVFADKVAVLYLGRVVEVGAAAEVIGNPKHPYTRALVDVMPTAGAARRGPRTLLTGEPPNATLSTPGCRFAPRCPLHRALGKPDRCLTEDPVLHIPNTGDNTDHAVACHFSDDTATTQQEDLP